jgi:hypothetical protein
MICAPEKPFSWRPFARQFDIARKGKMTQQTTVYKVVKLPQSLDERPTIIAMTSKQSAQHLIAALAELEGPERYWVFAFQHPELPLGLIR